MALQDPATQDDCVPDTETSGLGMEEIILHRQALSLGATVR